MSVYAVLGQGAITPEMLESNLADLKEAAGAGDFWFNIPVYSDISEAQVNIINWLNENNVWWKAVTEEGDPADQTYIDMADDLATTDAILDFMKDAMLEAEGEGVLLVLLESDLDNEPTDYDKAILDLLPEILGVEGNQVLELNNALTPLDVSPTGDEDESASSGITRQELENKQIRELRSLAIAEGWSATGMERDDIIAILLGEAPRPEEEPVPATTAAAKKAPGAKKAAAPAKAAPAKAAPTKAAAPKKAAAKKAPAAALTEPSGTLAHTNGDSTLKLVAEALEVAAERLRAAVSS